VLRILRVKEKLGLFDQPMAYHDIEREKSALLSAANREAARAIARQSIVLLKNDGKLLPLNPAKLKTIAVIGPLATDAMSSLGSWRAQGKADEVVTILQGITAAAPATLKILHAVGDDARKEPANNIEAAVRVARRADLTLLVIGEDYDMSGESRSRSSLELPPGQLDLAMRVLATGKPVVVVLANGRPLALGAVAERAPAILETWMLGVEAGNAVADVLFGAYSPAGRLPAAFPRATGASPFNYAANATGRPADPDLAKDTVRYHDLPITPLYAFGHGLSYSEFKYDDLAQSVEKIGPGERVDISISVANVGGVASDEVVQLYIRDPVASIARPVLELRGFKRVELGAGQKKRVTFSLTPDQFAFWSSRGQWLIEAGRIDFWIGASSADLRAGGSFEITKTQVGTAPATALPTRVIVSNH
jgi:beta-glucosidase